MFCYCERKGGKLETNKTHSVSENGGCRKTARVISSIKFEFGTLEA